MPVVLCQVCDVDDPAGGPIIVFFLVHEQVTHETAEQFLGLAHTWIAQLDVPAFDAEAFEADLAAWHAGEFDDPPRR